MRRSVQTPLARGATAAVVAGGAFSLMGAAAPLPAAIPAGADLPADAGTVVAPVAQALPLDPAFLRTAVEPVAPEPTLVDAADLVKAVRLAEEAARVLAEQQAREAQERAAQEKAARERAEAEEKAAAALGTLGCGLDTSALGPVKSYVLDAAEFLGCLYGEPTMHGVAGRAGTSDHPSGRAIDFMVDRATGDSLAACALRNMSALGISYVIWEQRINYGSGWEAMEDRGGVTANHFDHVHISFDGAGSGTPRSC